MLVGRARLLEEAGVEPPHELTGISGRTAVAVAWDGKARGVPTVADAVMDTSAEAVARLRALSLKPVLLNDAAAPATADLGLAMGTGTDAAIEAGDLTLVGGRSAGRRRRHPLSRRTLATIKGNLFWAFGYNVAALPPAAAGLLNPMIAGIAMAFSSVLVVSNSLRLRSFT